VEGQQAHLLAPQIPAAVHSGSLCSPFSGASMSSPPPSNSTTDTCGLDEYFTIWERWNGLSNQG
jgi:hypothetical protein